MELGTLTIVIIAIIALAAIVAVLVVVSAKNGRFKVDIGGQTPRAAGGSDTSSETGFKGRIAGLGLAAGGVLAVLAGRIWAMQLMRSEERRVGKECGS